MATIVYYRKKMSFKGGISGVEFICIIYYQKYNCGIEFDKFYYRYLFSVGDYSYGPFSGLWTFYYHAAKLQNSISWNLNMILEFL